MPAVSPIPTRPLGSTGERVSCLGVGGAHLGKKDVDEKLAIRIVRTAIDEGITFLDNSWDYHKGASEKRMGKALRDGYRERAFLMTKIDGRSGKAATAQLEESLKRLRVDTIDLVQHHEIIRYEDAHRIFHKTGAQAALEKARKAGKLRYIGPCGRGRGKRRRAARTSCSRPRRSSIPRPSIPSGSGKSPSSCRP